MTREMRKLLYELNKKGNEEANLKIFNGRLVSSVGIKDLEMPEGYSVKDDIIYHNGEKIGEFEVYNASDEIDISEFSHEEQPEENKDNKSDKNEESASNEEQIEETKLDEEDDLISSNELEIDKEGKKSIFGNIGNSINYGIAKAFNFFGAGNVVEVPEKFIKNSKKDSDIDSSSKNIEKESKKQLREKNNKMIDDLDDLFNKLYAIENANEDIDYSEFDERIKVGYDEFKELCEQNNTDQVPQTEEFDRIYSYLLGIKYEIEVYTKNYENKDNNTKQNNTSEKSKDIPKAKKVSSTVFTEEYIELTKEEYANRIQYTIDILKDIKTIRRDNNDISLSPYNEDINFVEQQLNYLYHKLTNGVTPEYMNDVDNLYGFASNLKDSIESYIKKYRADQEKSRVAEEDKKNIEAETKKAEEAKKVSEEKARKEVETRKAEEKLSESIDVYNDLQNELNDTLNEKGIDLYNSDYIDKLFCIDCIILECTMEELLRTDIDVDIDTLINKFGVEKANNNMEKAIVSIKELIEEVKEIELEENKKVEDKEDVFAEENVSKLEPLSFESNTYYPIDETVEFDDEDKEYVYDKYEFGELDGKINKLKGKLVDKKYYLAGLLKTNASYYEIEKTKDKIAKIEGKIAGYELKLETFKEMCLKKYEELAVLERLEVEAAKNRIDKNMEVRKEQEIIDFWTNVPEERLSQLQPYSDEEINEFYSSTNSINKDFINLLRRETPNDDIELYKMTKKQLIDYAGRKNILIPVRLKKSEIIEYIQEKTAEKNEKRLSL